MNENYKKLVKTAKQIKISSRDELSDLVSSIYEDCSGGEFECACKELKIKK